VARKAIVNGLPGEDLEGPEVTRQQLSVAATRRTLARIEALFGGHLPSPAELLGVDPGRLREAGLSWRKISTLRDLAGRLSDGRLNPDVLAAYQLDHLPSPQEVLAIAEKWRPYRSLATSYLFSAAFERAEAPPVTPRESAADAGIRTTGDRFMGLALRRDRCPSSDDDGLQVAVHL
jgi:DNA-3-methyladenine glycosylase II